MCHMSYGTCHMPRIRCHMSCVICHVSCAIFFWQFGGASHCRVCYQRGLPRLVLSYLNNKEFQRLGFKFTFTRKSPMQWFINSPSVPFQQNSCASYSNYANQMYSERHQYSLFYNDQDQSISTISFCTANIRALNISDVSKGNLNASYIKRVCKCNLTAYWFSFQDLI